MNRQIHSVSVSNLIHSIKLGHWLRYTIWPPLQPWLIVTILLLTYRFLQRYYVDPELAFRKVISIGVLFSSFIWLLLLPLIFQLLKRLPVRPLGVFIVAHVIFAIAIGLGQSYIFVYLHSLIWPGAINLEDALSSSYILTDLRLNFFLYWFFLAAIHIQKVIHVNPQKEHQQGWLRIKNQKGVTLDLSFQQIRVVQAMGNYVRVTESQVEGLKKHIVRDTMTSICEQLDSESFLRVQKSFIVNRRYVKGSRKGQHGEFILILDQGEEITTSRNMKESVKKWLESRA